MLVESEGELVDEGDIVRDSCFRSKILEVGNVFLESVIHDPIRAFERLLGELGELKPGSGFGIIGKESGLKVRSKLVEGFFGIGDRAVRHLVIPHFRERDASSLAHFVESGHDLVNIGGINRGVDGEIGLHGLDPSYSVGGFS